MCYLIRKRKIANEKIITLCVIIFLKEGDYSLKTLIFVYGSEISELCVLEIRESNFATYEYI